MKPRPATRPCLMCLLLAVSAPAWTQGVSAAEAEAAMARAQRQAANPMRVILEAGKGRARPREIENPPAAGVAAAPGPRASLQSAVRPQRLPPESTAER